MSLNYDVILNSNHWFIMNNASNSPFDQREPSQYNLLIAFPSLGGALTALSILTPIRCLMRIHCALLYFSDYRGEMWDLVWLDLEEIFEQPKSSKQSSRNELWIARWIPYWLSTYNLQWRHPCPNSLPGIIHFLLELDWIYFYFCDTWFNLIWTVFDPV